MKCNHNSPQLFLVTTTNLFNISKSETMDIFQIQIKNAAASFPSAPYSPQWREKSILRLLCQRVPRPTPRARSRMFTHHNKKLNGFGNATF